MGRLCRKQFPERHMLCPRSSSALREKKFQLSADFIYDAEGLVRPPAHHLPFCMKKTSSPVRRFSCWPDRVWFVKNLVLANSGKNTCKSHDAQMMRKGDISAASLNCACTGIFLPFSSSM